MLVFFFFYGKGKCVVLKYQIPRGQGMSGMREHDIGQVVCLSVIFEPLNKAILWQ